MSDIGSSYPIEIRTRETKEMQLKWIAVRRQEAKSKLVHFKQAIEDLIQGKVVDIERQIMVVEQELQQLDVKEKMLQSSVEAEQI